MLRISCLQTLKCRKTLWILIRITFNIGFNVEMINELRHEKTNIMVSDLVRHKPGCTATEDGERLEILDLESRGILLSM